MAEKQEYKRNRWQMCQDYFYRNRPDLEMPEKRIKEEKSIEPAHTISPQELETKAREI